MPLQKKPAPLDPVVKTINVPCSAERAFTLFVSEMDSWWPLGKFSVSGMAGGRAKAIRVEPKAGGAVTEIGPDGSEHVWGTIHTCTPNEEVSLDFHIPNPGDNATGRSRVEVRFTDLGDGRTRVDLTQSNWEAFGDMAVGLRAGYNGSWTPIFEQAFKDKCSG